MLSKCYQTGLECDFPTKVFLLSCPDPFFETELNLLKSVCLHPVVVLLSTKTSPEPLIDSSHQLNALGLLCYWRVFKRVTRCVGTWCHRTQEETGSPASLRWIWK